MLLEYSMDYVGKGNRRALGGAADDCQCPCGQTPFIEQASLHQIHVLIFAYAATHIIYGCVVMAFAQMKVLSNQNQDPKQNLNLPGLFHLRPKDQVPPLAH